jgi:mono/diheme cytochrome c family protein
MKNILKILGLTLAGITTLLTIGVLLIYVLSSSRMNSRFNVEANPIPTFTSAADIAEGKRLYTARGCADCHGDDAGGKTFINDPAIGHMTGSNLTTGKGGVARARSDAELARAVRHGVGKDGRALIFMPSTDFAGMTDEDTGRLIAYVRSVPPIDREPPKLVAGPLGRFLFLIGEIPLLVSAEKIDHAAKPVAKINPTVSVDYGKYIAATCTGCHRNNFQGGPIQGAPPEWAPAQNITGQALAKWNESQFITSLRTGKRPDGSLIKFPMPWQSLGKLNDTELKALWKYLQTL